jgi:hypothetical protein
VQSQLLPTQHELWAERSVEEQALLVQGVQQLKIRPYLNYKLHDSCDNHPLLERLGTLLSLRLWLLHSFQNPWLVGKTSHEHSQKLILWLFKQESAIYNRLISLQSTVTVQVTVQQGLLQYETLCVLHSVPPSHKNHPTHAVPSKQELIARWELKKTIYSWFYEFWKRTWVLLLYLWSLPWYSVRRWRWRKHLPKQLAQHPGVQETLYAIEQVSPVLDCLVFQKASWQSERTILCDWSALYIQLADELLDSLVKVRGHQAMWHMITDNYLPQDRTGKLTPLDLLTLPTLLGTPSSAQHSQESNLDEEDLGQRCVEKYSIKIGHLYESLAHLAHQMEHMVERLPTPEQQAIHRTLQSFFFHCFDTFVDELYCLVPEAGHPSENLSHLHWHFFRKNNLVTTYWLHLRAQLLGLQLERVAPIIQRWGYVIANFQLFDDLKDIGIDFCNQPNYVVQLSEQKFPQERQWLAANYQRFGPKLTVHDVVELNLHMPQSIAECMRYGRLMALPFFDWLACYVWDYRWKKSWTSCYLSFHQRNQEHRLVEQPSLSAYNRHFHLRSPLVRTIFTCIAATAAYGRQCHVSDEYLAYIFDLCLYDSFWQLILHLWNSPSRLYRLLFLHMSMTEGEKARLLQQLLRQQPKTVLLALQQYQQLPEEHYLPEIAHLVHSWLAPSRSPQSSPPLPPTPLKPGSTLDQLEAQ